MLRRVDGQIEGPGFQRRSCRPVSVTGRAVAYRAVLFVHYFPRRCFSVVYRDIGKAIVRSIHRVGKEKDCGANEGKTDRKRSLFFLLLRLPPRSTHSPSTTHLQTLSF